MSTMGASTQARPSLYLLRTQLRYELQERYVGSVGGVYWSLINPMLQVGIYMFVVLVVFGGSVSVGENNTDFLIYLLAGLSAWFSVQEALLAAATSLTRHSEIVKNVVFPLELLPIGAVLSAIVSLVATVGTLLILIFATGNPLGLSIVTFPLVLAVEVLIALGLGFFCAVINVVFRDFGYILPVLMQLGLLMTPIIYSIDDVPPIMQTISYINPLYQVVAAFQAIFFEAEFPNALGLAYAGVVGALLLGAGLMVFRRAKGIAEALV